MRQTTNGTNVCTLSLAVNRRFKDKTTGETVADFFNVIVWRQLAEICGRYLAKGRKVCVVGELQNRSYDAKDGTKRYVTEIVAEDVEFLTALKNSTTGKVLLTDARLSFIMTAAQQFQKRALRQASHLISALFLLPAEQTKDWTFFRLQDVLIRKTTQSFRLTKSTCFPALEQTNLFLCLMSAA